MERIKQFNLELTLFVKELQSYTENVNEIDDETTGLLVEAALGVNKLQIGSTFRDSTNYNGNTFVHNLNSDIFKCRRYIVCCLCHEQISMDADSFKTHMQKKNHIAKENVSYPHQIRSRTDCDRISDIGRSSVTSIEYEIPTTSSVNSLQNNDVEISPEVKIDEFIKVNPASTIKIEDIAHADKIVKLITTEISQLTCRSEERIKNETQVLCVLQRFFTAIDSKLEALSFGSSVYGFGGSETDLNILVNAGASEQVPALIMHNCKKIFGTLGAQDEFDSFNCISGDRVQKSRIRLRHKQTDLLCSIQFGDDFSLTRTSQIIRNCIKHSPICYHLIAYVKSWQTALNVVAKEFGIEAFHFNTYIISVLVIFFMQMKFCFPKINDVPSSKWISIDFTPKINSKENLKDAVKTFFEFYAENYEIPNQIIAVQVGGWQDRQLHHQQAHLTPEQKCLRDGIESNAVNWKNCSMYVQDLISPGLNIAAEIPKNDAVNFKKICQMFSADACHDKAIDEYVSGLSAQSTQLLDVSNLSLSSATSFGSASSTMKGTSEFSVHSLENQTKKGLSHAPIFTSQLMNVTGPPSAQEILNSSTNILNLIDEEVNTIRQMQSRQAYEISIISTLAEFIHNHKASLEILIFGSSLYNIRMQHTNFNIFVNTFGDRPKEVSQFFFFTLDKANISKDFKSIFKINADRVLRRQISMIHIESGIECRVLFESDKSIVRSSKIISKYIEREPMCRFLITYVRVWQNVLNEQGMAGFQFNTYIISILAIFFLQVNFNVPTVDNLSSSTVSSAANVENFETIPRQFFSFYSKSYQMWNHVISLHIGRWQERRIQPEQKIFSYAQQRLRKGIETSPENWKNCTMFVQDIVRPDVNVTAEIPQQDADRFQLMCQIFAKENMQDI